MTAHLEFAKRHLKDCQTDESKIELFGLNAKPHLWRKSGSMLCGYFSVAGTGRLVRIERKMNGAKYREILMKTCSRVLTFQQDSDPKHTAKTMQEWLQGKISECS